MQTRNHTARNALSVLTQSSSIPHSLTTSRLLRNQQQSPLLRLPAELRNRIYEVVLGGQEVRLIAPKPRGTYSFVLKLGPIVSKDNNTGPDDDDVEMSEDTTVAIVDDGDGEDLEYDHVGILEPVGTSRWAKFYRFLALAAISRQIHMETAPLAFSLNEFSGLYFSRLTSFVSALKPRQRNAITKVSVMLQIRIIWPLCGRAAGRKARSSSSTLHFALCCARLVD
jgi:hypothetical protein